MVELQDLTPFLKVKERLEEKRERAPSREEELKREVERLKKAFREEIETARREAYQRGLQEGYKRAKEEFERELKRREEELRKEFERELSSLKVSIDSIVKKLEEEGRRRLNKTAELFLDSLTEILEFLFISPNNGEYLKERIYQLIEEFSEQELLTVEVGKGLGEFIGGENVKLNPKLDDNDFRIVFKDFTVESNFKEKLTLLREEVEREVKEAT